MPKVVLFKLAENVSTATEAINISKDRLDSKAIAARIQLAEKSVESVGGICVDNSGNVYVSDDTQHVILRISESGQIGWVAGLAGTAGNNGSLQKVTTANARFNQPKGLACDNSGRLYVADYGNNQIRMIYGGQVSLYAGNGATTSGLVDSAADPFQAKFSHPTDVAVDNSGVVYVSDTDNHAIRKIWGGRVLTIAGGALGDAYDIRASRYIPFCSSPKGIAVDAKGNIFVCDSGNDQIKKITPNGWVYLHSGAFSEVDASSESSESSEEEVLEGTVPKAFDIEYEGLTYIAVDRGGYQYVTDVGDEGSQLIKVDPNGVPNVVIDFVNTEGNASGVSGVAVSPAGKVFVTITEDIEESSEESSSEEESGSEEESSSEE